MPKRHRATSAPQRTAPPHGMTPIILGRRDTVAVLIQAPFDAWYDQWMLQIDDTDAAANPAGVDFFDDAVRMLESAAIGMAVVALRTHLDAHQADYITAGVTVLVEPRMVQDDALICLLGVLETMHEEGEGWRADGERSFVETIAHDALAVPVYRAAESPSQLRCLHRAIHSSRQSTTARCCATRRSRMCGRIRSGMRSSMSR
jgi:hypothetical protein